MKRLIVLVSLLLMLSLTGCSWLNFLTGGARNSDEYHSARLGNPVYPGFESDSAVPPAGR
ncbi:MAG: hypothetical protein AB7O59_05635 [Pirellulales bacterium]